MFVGKITLHFRSFSLLLITTGSLYGQTALSQDTPSPPPEETRATTEKPGWLVDYSGCWHWSGSSVPVTDGLTIEWSGTCGSDGPAKGRGTWIGRLYGREFMRYEGEMQEGRFHGKGINTNSKGSRYEGDFKNGKSDGHGVTVLPSGIRYEGQYKNGKPEGYGVMTSARGARYEGEWKEGKPHGRGVAISTSGERKEGEWREGKLIQNPDEQK